MHPWKLLDWGRILFGQLNSYNIQFAMFWSVLWNGWKGVPWNNLVETSCSLSKFFCCRVDKMLKPTQHTCQCYSIRTFLWNFVARSYYTDISLHSTKIIEGVVTDDLALWFTRYIPSRTHKKEVLFEKIKKCIFR